MISDSRVGKKFSGFFRGQVLAHLPCGRCKIWIPDVYPEEWKNTTSDFNDVYGKPLAGAKIPDAEQASPFFAGGTSNSGTFSYPKINSYVWCFFERDDIQHPVYFASTIDTEDMTEKNSFEKCTIKNDLNKGTSIIQCGKISITLNEGEEGEIKITNGDSTITMQSGTINIEAENIILKGNISLESDVYSLIANKVTEMAILKSSTSLRSSTRTTGGPGSCTINGTIS